MIGYETYKWLHILLILIFFTSLGFVASSKEFMQKKSGKIILGLVSFLIMVAGMGLIARIGLKHGEPFPIWIILKFVAWLLINVFFVLLFKMKEAKVKLILTLLILLTGSAAAWVAINKP